MVKMRLTYANTDKTQDFEVDEQVADRIELAQNGKLFSKNEKVDIYQFNALIGKISEDEGQYLRMTVIAGQKEYVRL